MQHGQVHPQLQPHSQVSQPSPHGVLQVQASQHLVDSMKASPFTVSLKPVPWYGVKRKVHQTQKRPTSETPATGRAGQFCYSISSRLRSSVRIFGAMSSTL